MGEIDWGRLVVVLHLPFVLLAAVLIAVPRWRRWLLSQGWSPALFIVALYGGFYIAMLWPDALGGWSVGLPLAFALVGGLLIWLVVSFINEWRSDRASAIETLALVAILTGSAVAAELFIGKDYWWLAIGPVAVWFGVRWLMAGARARREGD